MTRNLYYVIIKTKIVYKKFRKIFLNYLYKNIILEQKK